MLGQYLFMPNDHTVLTRIRILLVIVIAGLVASGISALPLLTEVTTLDHLAQACGFPPFVTTWVRQVHDGLEKTYAAYPFMAYGTDWLAFGHFVIALFLVGPFFDPVRNVWVI